MIKIVDFDNEATIGTPDVDIVRVLILQRRADVFEALEQYNKDNYANIQTDISVIKARLYSLFLELQGGLKRRLKAKDYNDLVKQLDSKEPTDVLKVILMLNEYLDSLNLTKIDTKKKYDKTRVEKEHKVKGL